MSFKNHASGSGMVMILSLAAIGIGVVGWVLPIGSCQINPSSPCLTKVQSGTLSCTITAATACVTTANFSPSYTVKPKFLVWWNGTANTATSTITGTTSVTVTSPVGDNFVFQATDNTNWANLPIAETELYAHSNQRLTWTTPSSFSSQKAYFCVSVTSAPTNGNDVQFNVQYSTNQASWTDIDSGTLQVTGTGFQCSSVDTVALTVSTQYYFRVTGFDALSIGGGTIGLGTIEMVLSGTYSTTVTGTTSIVASAGCYPTTSTLTISAGLVRVVCATTTTNTFTINWLSGVPA